MAGSSILGSNSSGTTGFDELLRDIRRDCGWETIPYDKLPELARLCGPAEIDRLIRDLDALDNADLVDDAGDMADEYWRVRVAYARVLALIGEPAVRPLLAALGSSNLQTRACAAEALGAIQNPRTFEPIAALLADAGNATIKTNLIRALGYLRNERGVELLLPFLETREQNRGHTIAVTAGALGSIGTESVVAPLTNILANDPDWYARYHVVEALFRMEPRLSREMLRIALKDPDDRVSSLAKHVLWDARIKRLRAMIRRLHLWFLFAGLALLAGGFLYDVLFAGIPYQDPTPEMASHYELHSRIASWIMWSGGIASLAGLELYVFARRHRA